MPDIAELMLNRRDFAQGLDAVYRCAAKQYRLAGVFVSFEKNILKTVATDGSMLAQYRASGAGSMSVECAEFSVFIDLRDVPLMIEWLKSDSFLEEKCRTCRSKIYSTNSVLSDPICFLTKTETGDLRIRISDSTSRILTARLLNIDQWPNLSKVMNAVPNILENIPDKYIGMNPAYLEVVFNCFKAIDAQGVVLEPSGKEQPFIWSSKHGCVELLIIQMPVRGAVDFIRDKLG